MLERGGCRYSAAGLEIEPPIAETPPAWILRGAQCVHWFTLLSYLVTRVIHATEPLPKSSSHVVIGLAVLRCREDLLRWSDLHQIAHVHEGRDVRNARGL